MSKIGYGMIIVYVGYKTIRGITGTTCSAPSFKIAATIMAMDGTRILCVSFPLSFMFEDGGCMWRHCVVQNHVASNRFCQESILQYPVLLEVSFLPFG